jgi:hypothetical protein
VATLWQCVKKRVELPAPLSREDVHRLLPSPERVAEQVGTAYSEHVRAEFAQFSEVIGPVTSLAQLVLRHQVTKKGATQEVGLAVESRWDDREDT